MKQLIRALVAGRAIKRSIQSGRLAGENPIDSAFKLIDEIADDIQTADQQLDGLDQAWRSKLREFERKIKKSRG
jgi:hypothetical protein